MTKWDVLGWTLSSMIVIIMWYLVQYLGLVFLRNIVDCWFVTSAVFLYNNFGFCKTVLGLLLSY